MSLPQEACKTNGPTKRVLLSYKNGRVLTGCLVVALAAVSIVDWQLDPKKRRSQAGRVDDSQRLTLSELKRQSGGDLHVALSKMANSLGSADGEINEVNLDYSAVTDEDLSLLAELAQLRSVSLGGTGIGDVGLEHLGRLENLETVSLYYTGISGQGLKALSTGRHLRVLNLLGAVNAANGLKYLKDLPHLETLMLESLPVTDEHIADLKDLKRLSTLNLVGTQMTDQGLVELRAALPNCVIYGPR